MADSHSGRDAVRVDYHVWYHALDSEGEVFLSEHHAASALLAVSGGKFIPYLRHFGNSCLYLCHTKARSVLSNHDFIYIALLASFHGDGAICDKSAFLYCVFIVSIADFDRPDYKISLFTVFTNLR